MHVIEEFLVYADTGVTDYAIVRLTSGQHAFLWGSFRLTYTPWEIPSDWINDPLCERGARLGDVSEVLDDYEACADALQSAGGAQQRTGEMMAAALHRELYDE